MRCWTRGCRLSAAAAPAPRVSPTRGDVGEAGAGNGPPPQRSAGGGAETSGEYATYVGPRAQKTPPLGMRPASLAEPQGAQERVQRDTVEQCGELAPTVQILDAPVPQSGDQLLETLKIDVVEQVIEVPKIILLDYTPLRAVPREPQMAEQLVEVPVPVWTELTRDRDVAGSVWCRIAAYGDLLVAIACSTLPVAHPAGDHRQPRAVYNYWARMRIFYGPLYLAVTCSVLVCLRSACVDFFRETTSGFISVFSASWFDSGYMFLPVYGGFLHSDPVIDSRPALFCFRIQRNAWSSVVHAFRQSTEW